jgi:DNA processing protein
VNPAELRERTRAERLRFVIPGDKEWPEPLADLAGCEPVNQLSGVPLGLWLAGGGDLAELAGQSVAMVGSRASTPYGDTVASELAAELSESGRAVFSGGAYGIDAAAHRGCLAGRTPTVAVMAGGLDQPYPTGHRPLFDRIAERGVLVSELPPGEHPTRVRFLARNRLIAALSPGTVLVEAAVRSGARNTVTWANVLGRIVMAVPGPVTSATSVTPHLLIRDAEAILVARAGDVLELLSPLGRDNPRPPSERRPTDELSAEELRVFEAVPGRGSLGAGELALRAGMTLPTCLALLDQLADQGFLVQNLLGQWQLPPRSGQRAR